MNTYKTNIIDNWFRGDSMEELNRLKDCYLENIASFEKDLESKKINESEYFESMLCQYEKLSALKEMVIYKYSLTSNY